MKVIGIPAPTGLTQSLRDIIIAGYAVTPVNVFVDNFNNIWIPIDWVAGTTLVNYQSKDFNSVDEWYQFAKDNNYATLNIGYTTTQTHFAPEITTQDLVNTTEQAIVDALPDSIVRPLETTGAAISNTIYNVTSAVDSAAGNTPSTSTEAEKATKAKKVLLGISGVILAIKLLG